MPGSYEQHHEQTAFLPMRKQRCRSASVKLISPFVFATQTVQFLFFVNPKIQASSLLLRLYRPVHVRPGGKPRRPVFSLSGSYELSNFLCFLFSCNSNSKSPNAIKLGVAGGDAYINTVLRPYIEQFSAKSPDWQNYVRFLVIPFGKCSKNMSM